MSPTVGHVTHRRDRTTVAFAIVVGLALTGRACQTALRPEVATRGSEIAREVDSRHALIRGPLIGYSSLSRLALTARSPVDHQSHAIEPHSLRASRRDLRAPVMSGANGRDLVRRRTAARSPLAFFPQPFTHASLKPRLQSLLN